MPIDYCLDPHQPVKATPPREALADPAHERHAELAEWWGAKDFDPNNAAFADLNRAVEDLVEKWARRTRRKT